MDVNSVNISSIISSQMQQKLSLNPGQIIKAQVVKLEGNQVILQLGGNLLRAQTKIDLKPGENLKLRVESSQNNLVELRIMSDNERIKPEDAILLRLGIKPQETLETLVQQFMKLNLPVSQADIMEMNSVIKGNNLTEDTSQLIVWLKSVGIKVDSGKDIQVLQALRRFFKGEISGAEEAKFFKFLNTTENNIFGGYNIFGWPLGNNQVFLVTQAPKGERLQSENCELFLKVNSQGFEELWFKMEHINNNLRVNIVCISDRYKMILEKEVGLLQNLLQTAGYNINEVPIEVSKTKPTIFNLISDPGRGISYLNLEV